MANLICTLCGYTGSSKKKVKGNILIEIVLWLFFLIPGLIYSIWRLSSKQDVCPKCGNPSMIPANTPMGQKLMADFPVAPPTKEEELATQKSNNTRSLVTVALILFVFIGIPLFYSHLSKSSENNSQVTDKKSAEEIAQQNDTRTQAEKDKDEIEKNKTDLIANIEGVKKFNGTNFRDSAEKIGSELTIFSDWARLVNRTKNSTDAEVKKLSKTLETNLIALQNKEFPQLRLAWGKILKAKIWEANVEVSVSGSKNSMLELVGATYASNANVSDTQSIIQDMVKNLRFDRVTYKWYEYDDHYPYYTIDSKKDSDVAIIIIQN